MARTFMSFVLAMVLVHTVRSETQQSPTECADGSMTLWMQNSDGKNPCELVQDVLRVCDASYKLDFLPRGYTCDNGPGSALAPCCCGSPTFALMSACWSCQYNITFDLVSTTFTGFEKNCETLPDPITTYDASVRSNILALNLPAWSEVEPLAGKWDFAGAWRNATPNPTTAAPVPTGYPIQVNSTGISKGALAGAIIGAILGSKLLFMAAGYVFYRWWRGQQEDRDDEKGYAHRVLGEPRHGRRVIPRSRRGSRGHVDLDEDTNSPRWPGVPPYLHPTSFHSHSSRGSDSHPEQDAQQPSGSRAYGPGRYPQEEEGGVTPFIVDQRPVESEKSRQRRQSTSLRVTNDHSQSGEEGSPPAPQPALLAHAHSVSYGPTSPRTSRPLISPASRSNSASTSNIHGHSSSSASTRYQEDDAGVSLVIESSGSGSHEADAIRCVPPAYVDYRQGYSSDKPKPKPIRRRTESTSANGGSSGGGGTGASDSASATYIGSSDGPSRAPSIDKSIDAEPERHEADTMDAKTMTETNTVREPEPDEPRDRTTSGDSEGASTIKPPEPPVDAERPVTAGRSSTTDIAALTAANTSANRAGTERPAPTSHSSAPAEAVLGSSPDNVGDSHSSSHDITRAQSSNTDATSGAGAWSWGRALGVFGLTGAPASGSSS